MSRRLRIRVTLLSTVAVIALLLLVRGWVTSGSDVVMDIDFAGWKRPASLDNLPPELASKFRGPLVVELHAPLGAWWQTSRLAVTDVSGHVLFEHVRHGTYRLLVGFFDRPLQVDEAHRTCAVGTSPLHLHLSVALPQDEFFQSLFREALGRAPSDRFYGFTYPTFVVAASAKDPTPIQRLGDLQLKVYPKEAQYKGFRFPVVVPSKGGQFVAEDPGWPASTYIVVAEHEDQTVQWWTVPLLPGPDTVHLVADQRLRKYLHLH